MSNVVTILRPVAGSLLTIALCLFCGGQTLHGQSDGPTAEKQFQEKLDDIESEVTRLRKAGDAQAADAMATRLQEFRDQLSNEYRLEPGKSPESHVVMVQKAGVAPVGVLSGVDRFRKGYVEVRVSSTGRPVNLVLGGYRPIHWKVELADGARLHSVILTGREAQSVDGYPAETLVFDQNATRIPFAYSRQHESFGLMKEHVRQFTGQPVSTFTGRSEASSSPIVVGPSNKEWRAQHLLHRIAELHEQSQQFELERKRAAVADLRFQALWFIRNQNNEGYGRNSTAMAEFTADGPIESSLRPTYGPLRHFAEAPAAETTFGIDHWTQLVIVEPGARNLEEVPLDPDVPNLRRLNCLALDNKRNRLVFPSRDGKPDLFALDLKKVRWSHIGVGGSRLGALTYDSDADVFYGIPLLDHHGFRSGREKGVKHIERISADASRVDRIPLSDAILPFWGDHGGIQLRLVEGRLVIVVPPVFEPDGRTVSRLYVVDPKTGDVIYSGNARVHDGKGQSPSPPEAAPRGVLARFNRRVAEATAAITAIREQDLKRPADELAAQLEEIEAVARGHRAEQRLDDPVLHMVGTHSGDRAVVRVTQTNRPVVLAVSSYNKSTWKVEAAPGVQIVKVIAAGYHQQRVEGLPQQVPVETYSSDERNKGFYIDEEDDPRLPGAIDRLREITGLTLSTFLVTRDHGTIEVGPGNATWQLKRALDRVDRLLKRAEEHVADDGTDPVTALRFTGLWMDEPTTPQQFGFAGGRKSYLAEFTPQGPLFSSLRELDARATRVSRVTASPDGRYVFSLAGSGLTRLDPDTGRTTSIPLGEKMPRFSHPRDITFDNERKRVLIATLGGDGYLYACNIETKTWTASSLGGIDLEGLAWVPDTDALYGLVLEYGRPQPKLVRLTTHGVALETVSLERSIAGVGDHHRPIQLHGVGRFLVLQTLADGPIRRAGDHARSSLYVIDPQDGSIVHSATARPHTGHENFTLEQLTKIWSELRDANDADGNRLAWRLAAGGEQTVTFLADVIVPAGSDVDKAATTKLIDQLSSDNFKEREDAQRKLSQLGSITEPLLRQKLQQSVSAELRRRIAALLQSWQDGKATNPDKRRELFAVTVLARIGSPTAKRLLESLATGAAADLTTRQSKTELSRWRVDAHK